jgi:hypothetical protein
MLAHLPGRGLDRRRALSVSGRVGRTAAVLAALACAVLASAAAIPAASAGIVVPGPGEPYGPAGVTPLPRSGVQVITAGGMAGWQVTLIAVGAAVLAAAAAVYLDRALTTRRAGLIIAARRPSLTRAQHRPGARPARCPGADPACQAPSARDTRLPAAAPVSGLPDIVEFGP